MKKDINEQLLEASTNGDVNEIMKLLKNGADVECIDHKYKHTR